MTIWRERSKPIVGQRRSRRACLYESQTYSPGDRVGPAAGVEALAGLRDILFDRPRGQAQPFADFTGGCSFADQLQAFDLPRAEARGDRTGRASQDASPGSSGSRPSRRASQAAAVASRWSA